jgi:hypothetical protein
MIPSRLTPHMAVHIREAPSRRRSRLRRGGVLINVLVFLLITTVILSGMGQFVVSHQNLVTVESNHASALDLAESGINYELRKMSTGGTADSQSSPYAGTLGSGSFSVYVTGTSGGSYSPGSAFDIVSSGTVNGVTRKIQIQGGPVGSSGSNGGSGVFTIGTGAISGSVQVNGDLGTDGSLSVSGYGDVTGHVYINGPGASWSMSGAGTYNLVYNSAATSYPTVDQLANAAFPASTYPPGGLAYLATHNSNASAGLGTTLTGSVTLQPGNYYFTSINVSGSNSITFNNASGAINVWVGPSAGSGSVTISGSTTAVSLATNPNVHIYVATKGGMNLSGYDNFQAGFYAYDVDSGGNPFGSINISGSTAITGQIVGYNVSVSGYMDLTSVGGLFSPSSGAVGFTGPWTETNTTY